MAQQVKNKIISLHLLVTFMHQIYLFGKRLESFKCQLDSKTFIKVELNTNDIILLKRKLQANYSTEEPDAFLP